MHHSSRFESIEISDKNQRERVLNSWHKLVENASVGSAISTDCTTVLVLLAPPVLYLSRTLLLHPSRSGNTETSNRKDGRNIIPCETELEAGILVEKASDGSALSTNNKTILCVASTLCFHNGLAPRLHIPRVSNVKTSDKDLEKGFNAEGELEAGT